MVTQPVLDQWAAWLLHRRDGGDPAERQRTLRRLAAVRDRVLDNARPAPGETLLDVGTGEGLIAFCALERVGERGSVIFSDISTDLLDHDRLLAEQLNVADHSRFVRAAAEDLSSIADGSVDVLTTRSVLAYVHDTRPAFAAFFRVLRPGGRISLYEPINSIHHHESADRFFGYGVTPVQDLTAKLMTAYERRQNTVTGPMFDYDELDLLGYAEEAGFGERHLEFRIDVTPHQPKPWEPSFKVRPIRLRRRWRRRSRRR